MQLKQICNDLINGVSAEIGEVALINRIEVTARTTQMTELWNYTEAAMYCGLPVVYFRNIVKGGTGPNYVKPTPRKIMFRQHDLDWWIATWVDRSGTAPLPATSNIADTQASRRANFKSQTNKEPIL
jgi:hypothetical protein